METVALVTPACPFLYTNSCRFVARTCKATSILKHQGFLLSGTGIPLSCISLLNQNLTSYMIYGHFATVCQNLSSQVHSLPSLSPLPANIVLIYRRGKKTEPLNYRPVSLTSVVGKICEIIIKEEWVGYLEENEVISNRQVVFRWGNSYVTKFLHKSNRRNWK